MLKAAFWWFKNLFYGLTSRLEEWGFSRLAVCHWRFMPMWLDCRSSSYVREKMSSHAWGLLTINHWALSTIALRPEWSHPHIHTRSHHTHTTHTHIITQTCRFETQGYLCQGRNKELVWYLWVWIIESACVFCIMWVDVCCLPGLAAVGAPCDYRPTPWSLHDSPH